METYIHGGGRIGAMVEVNCETDFVARTDEFKSLARDIAMQIVAMNPRFISIETASEEEIARDGLTADDVKQTSLLSQVSIRDSSRTIGQMITETIAKSGENIRVRRFHRFELGR